MVQILLEPMFMLCDGTLDCGCWEKRKAHERSLKYRGARVEGGTLMSQYKKGSRTPEARAANAAYMKNYRNRKANA